MNPSSLIHIILVRPPGSLVWTIHCKHHSVPWQDSRPDAANHEAQNIVEHSKYCAVVVPIKVKPETDNVQYALFADGDTLYKPSEPFLTSLATGEALK